jgi:hypothetical protein
MQSRMSFIRNISSIKIDMNSILLYEHKYKKTICIQEEIRVYIYIYIYSLAESSNEIQMIRILREMQMPIVV